MEFWLLTSVGLPALAVLVTALVTLNVYEHRRYARSRLRSSPTSSSSPRVLLLAPCKGLDVGLEDNLRPLLEQDYDNYEVAFLVESADDPACGPIERVLARYPQLNARLIITGKAPAAGQKIHNLLVATEQLPSRIEALAFVDSDARPHAGWLRALVDRLGRDRCGAITGYRWFAPQSPSLANYVIYSVNAGVGSLFGTSAWHLVWGGSWAIRRDVFESIDLRGAWQGTLSDDLVAARELHKAGLDIMFEPACVVASPVDNTMPQTLEFLRRQYVIGRSYVPRWWLGAVLTTATSVVGFWGGLAAIGYGLAAGAAVWPPAALCGAYYGLSVLRGRMRRDLARMYLGARFAEAQAAAKFDMWLAPVAALVNLAAMLSSCIGSRIVWRGIAYDLDRRGRVLRISRGGEPRFDRADLRLDPPQPLAGAHRSGVQEPTADSGRLLQED